MSFDIYFQPCCFTESPSDTKDPDNGSTASAQNSAPLEANELRAVQEVLSRARSGGVDRRGADLVRMPDGGEAELFSDDLKSGCMVAIRGLTSDLLQFLYDLMAAGKWVMLPTIDDEIAITCCPEHLVGLPGDFPRIVVCKSAGARDVTDRRIRAWQKYRDQVAGDGE